MSRRWLVTAVIAGLLVGPVAFLLWTRAGQHQRAAAALTYQIPDHPALRPWIAAAAEWPDLSPESIAAAKSDLPRSNPWLWDKLRVHLEDFVPKVIAREWLATGFPDSVTYLEGWGFVWELERAGVRVRVRFQPCFLDGSYQPVVFLAAEPPPDTPWSEPTDVAQLGALVNRFLGSDVPSAGALSSAGHIPTNPGFLVTDAFGDATARARVVVAHTLAECPYPEVHDLHPDPSRTPAAALHWRYGLWAWSDGRVLLGALVGRGPAPSAPTAPPPDSKAEALAPPPREPIEVKPSLTPEELAREVSPERMKH